MKKIIVSMVALMSTVSVASADDFKDTWDVFKPSASVEKNSELSAPSRSRSTKGSTVRDVPIVGDIVKGFEQGMASFYWQPQAVACGGRFNPSAMTAAHKTLPCGTKVRVTNSRNGKSVVVTINDRGPFVRGRIIDLSKAAASEIGMISSGVAPVSIDRL